MKKDKISYVPYEEFMNAERNGKKYLGHMLK
jgi:hypothetical protein